MRDIRSAQFVHFAVHLITIARAHNCPVVIIICRCGLGVRSGVQYAVDIHPVISAVMLKNHIIPLTGGKNRI